MVEFANFCVELVLILNVPFPIKTSLANSPNSLYFSLYSF